MDNDLPGTGNADVHIVEAKGGGLIAAAALLAIVGITIMVIAVFVYDASVASNSDGTFGVPERIMNSGRMQIQMIMFLFGCSCFVSGVISTAIAVAARSFRTPPAH